MEPTAASPHPSARFPGVVYLLYFLTARSAGLLMRGIVVSRKEQASAAEVVQ